MGIETAAILGAAAIGTGTSIAASREQANAAKDARQGLQGIQERQLRMQEDLYRRFQVPELQRFAATLDTLQGEAGRSTEDVQQALFGRATRLNNTNLAATGNLRSGVAAEKGARVALDSVLAAENLRDTRLSNVASLSSRQGALVGSQASDIGRLIASLGGDVASTQLYQGAANAQPWAVAGQQFGGALQTAGILGMIGG